jgi:CDP-glycerol glycerophosphotransferase
MNFFVRTDKQTVLFQAFDGRGFLDNPKAIFEAMRKAPKFKDYELIWALHHPVEITGSKVVKKNSFAYYYYLSKAKYWVFNHKMPEYLVKKSDQIYLQTWHGTPLKRLAHDLPDTGLTYYRSKQSYQEMLTSYDKDSQLWDYLISPNPFSTAVFASAFQFPKDKILETGYPRNDVLISPSATEIKQIKAKFNLPQDKKIILYAPTWRDNAYNLKGYTFDLQIDFAKWQEKLGDQYLVIFKPHYLISNQLEVPSDFVRTLPATADITDLYLISDCLITDYSSVFFDYANLNRPIYFYMPDIESYQEELRGFYLEVPKELPNDICQTEADLLEAISSDSFDTQRLSAFNQRFNVLQDGHVSQKVIEEVLG